MTEKKNGNSWITLIGLTITVSLIVGMIGGALTNEYLVGYVFDTFVKEKSDEEFPIVKKVIEKQTYVEDSLIQGSISNVEPSLVTLYASSIDLSKAINKNVSVDSSFIKRTSDFFYNGNYPVSDFENGGVLGGNGFFISTDGLIVTCNSVVESQMVWNVLTSDGDKYMAQVVYSDAEDDIAFMKINESGDVFVSEKPMEFAENDILMGQKVLALGTDVFSKLHVKSGIISYMHTPEEKIIEAKRIFPAEFTQTDFEIDSSLHCSPLVNLMGQLEGVILDFDAVEQGSSYVIPVQNLQETLIEYQQS